jgi:hypothetical protein
MINKWQENWKATKETVLVQHFTLEIKLNSVNLMLLPEECELTRKAF